MRFMPNYPVHAVFFGAARRSSEIWRLVLGLFLAVGFFVLLTQLYLRAIDMTLTPAVPTILDDLAEGKTALSMYLLMFSFAMITISIGLVVRLLHRRSARSLLGPIDMAVPQFAAVTFMLAVLAVVLTLLSVIGAGDPLVPNLALGRWLVLLPLSMIAVLVQVSAEEIFFRGYIQQQLAARFRSPLVWMLLPSVIFGVGHYQPEAAGENAVMIAAWAGVFGMMMADLTARAGTLGPAIAVHFCNNVLALVVVSLPDELSGLSLYHTPFGMGDTEALRAWLPVDFAQMLVFWLAARLALRR